MPKHKTVSNAVESNATPTEAQQHSAALIAYSSELCSHLEQLAAVLSQRYRLIPDYASLDPTFTLDLAREDLRLVAGCLQAGDTAPFEQHVKERTLLRLREQNFTPASVLQAIDAIEDTALSETVFHAAEQIPASRFITHIFAQARQVFTDASAELLKQADQELHETTLKQSREQSEAQQRIMESMAVGILITRLLDGAILYANRIVGDILGVQDSASMLNRPIPDFYYDPADRQTILTAVQQKGALQNFELRAKKADGSLIWTLISVQPIQYSGETALLTSLTDITHTKQTEDRYRHLATNLSDWIWEVDAQGRYTYLSEKVTEILGYTPAELLGKTPFDTISPDHLAPIVEKFGSLAASKHPIVDLENWNVHKNGQLRCMLTSGLPILDETGSLIGYRGIDKDITDRKLLEQQIQASYERRGQQVRLSAQIAEEIADAIALQDLYQRVVTLVKERLDYYHAQILQYEPGLDAVLLIAGYGQPGKAMLAQNHRLPMGVGLIGAAAARGQTVMRPDLAGDPDWKPNPLLPDTRGEIAVPIKLGQQILGILDVQSNQPGALGEDDRLLLEGLCGQIAIAIESTRLRQQMQDRIEELNTLYRATSREGWRTFQSTGRVTTGYLYDRLSVTPLDSTPGDVESPVSDSESASKRSDALTVPLTVRGEPIGTLGVYNDPQNPLSESDLQLVELVSDQVTQALESVRLFDQSQEALTQTQELYISSAQIITADTYQAVLDALVNASAFQKLTHAYIYFFDTPLDPALPLSQQRAQAMFEVAGWSLGSEPFEPIGTQYKISEYPSFSLLRPNQPLLIDNIATDLRLDTNTRALFEMLGVQGLFMMPLESRGEWFGLLDGETSNPLQLTTDEIRQVSSLVNQAATVLQSLRLQHGMQDRLSELTGLQRMMSREAWAAHQSQARAENLGYLFNMLELLPISEPIGPSSKLPVVTTVSGATVSDATVSAATTSSYTTPLTVRGEPIGIIGVQTGQQSFLLTPEDEAFLQTVSDQVAQALERARLMEQTQKTAVELQVVAEVSTATSTLLDPNQLLQTVVDLTKDNFGLYHAHVYLLDQAAENLTLAIGSGEVGRTMIAEGWSIPFDDPDSLVARAARLRTGQIIADTRRQPAYLPNALLPNTLSELAVPMLVADRLLGIFDVQSDRPNRFASTDIRTFTTLASQTAVALQNARLYAEQITAIERLRELDNMKSAFLANMSHELRTPLNSILGFTQVVLEGLDGPLTDLMVSDLELIEKNGKHLLSLINDVLDMAKIEAGRYTLSLEPINVYDLLEDVIMTTSPLARDRNLYMRLEATPSEDWIVSGDHVRLRQIFINLIGNSLKFTDSGGITIEIEKIISVAVGDINAVTTAGSIAVHDRIQIRIRDTGIGIPVNKLESIFEAFSQVDSSTTRKAGGTGLGLPISRRLVEMHGGRLWANSSGIPGEGTTLFLELLITRPEI